MTFNRDTYVSVFRFKEPTKNGEYTIRGKGHCLSSTSYEKNLISINPKINTYQQ